MGARVPKLVAAAAVLVAVWLYVELVVWHGLRWHIRAAWLRPSSLRRARRAAERRGAGLDREIRRFLRSRDVSRQAGR
jgi:uncharacterized membrane-anchored protein